MSIVYGFISEKRREEIEGFKKLLTELNADYVSKLNSYVANHLLMEDAATDVENALRHSVLMLVPNVDEEHHIVCTVTSTNVHWRIDNGFCCFEDVEKFAAEHPELVLENEYSQKLSMADFATAVKVREVD